MMTFLRSAIACACLSLAMTGCGDEGDGESDPFGPGCDDADCRGDPTGSWEVIGSCAIDPLEESDECAGLQCSIVSVDGSGSYDFAADGAASFAWTATVATDCRIPKSCIETTCEELATATRTCTDNGDVCSCSQTDESSQGRTGTWSVDEVMLAITDAEGMTGTSNWCVRDDHLAINGLASRPLQFGGVGFVGLAKLRLTAARR